MNLSRVDCGRVLIVGCVALVLPLLASAVAVADVAPVNDVAPSVSGSTRPAQTLTADPGTWSGTAPITYGYQWRRCDDSGASCADIMGATAATYLTADSDLGGTLRVVVTATNAAATRWT